MASNIVTVAVLVVMLLKDEIRCDGSTGLGVDDSSSIPLLASGKRQHNIMRFGKRPAPGHNLIHFGKREGVGSPPQHSFLYFGKREGGELPDLFDLLQRNQDASYKRGHSIMRFGKRAPPHNFIRFGRGHQEDEDEEEDKRSTGHSMMYFGKRAPPHSFIRFGRGQQDDKPNAGHSMMYFGKREDGAEEDPDLLEKKAHSMIHFGKREEDRSRQGSHAMIHFGKRDAEDEEDDTWYWNPELSEAKRQHNLLRFGKKMDRKGSHAMIHFGKRNVEEEKRAHAMIHFGKRSVDVPELGNQSDKGIVRMKREVEQPTPSLVSLIRYDDPEEDIPEGHENIQSPLPYSPSEIWNPLEHQEEEEEDWEPGYVEYGHPYKKDASKNAFLRFG